MAYEAEVNWTWVPSVKEPLNAFALLDVDDTKAQVTFRQTENDIWWVEWDVRKRGTAHKMLIINGVVRVIEDFVDRMRPKQLGMGSDTAELAQIYKRYIDMRAKLFGYSIEERPKRDNPEILGFIATRDEE